MTKIYKIIIICASIAVLIGIIFSMYFVFGNNSQIKVISAEVKTGDITEKVNLTGQVKSSQGVDLSFESQGKIVANYVKAGDKIYMGQTLAIIDQSSARASLTSAQGYLAQAKANYEKLTVGPTQQASSNSVYADALNSLSDAYLKAYNSLVAVTNLQNTYFVGYDGDARQGKTQIEDAVVTLKYSLDKAKDSKSQADVDSAIYTSIHSLNIISDALKIIRETCDSNFYYGRIPDSEKTAIDSQRAYVAGALTAMTKNQEAVLQNGPNMDLARGQILVAQGQVDSAQAVLNHTVLFAPFNGQVDKDNAVVGQLVSSNTPIITISNDNLEIDTSVSEIDLPTAKIGGLADATLDAYGNGVNFPAIIFSVDSAPTVVNGVSSYGVKFKFKDLDTRIKPGMTANIKMLSDTHENVLLIPKSAVIQNNGKYFVLINNGTTKKETREVIIGLHDDSNIEIVSGLQLGEKVFAY